jgi:Mg2+ and Co2+ transporter CorA
MNSSLNALFFILLLSTTVLTMKHEDDTNLLELMDQSPEGRDILNSIFLELESLGPNLDRGKIYNILKTTRNNVAKTANNAKEGAKRLKKGCQEDLTVLKRSLNENERHQFTINRHVNSNTHAQRKNQQYLDRSRDEFNGYEALRNLLLANKKNWDDHMSASIANLKSILGLLKSARGLLKKARANHQPVAAGKKPAFVQLDSEYVNRLSEIRVEFANTKETNDGLRPIITNLLQTMADPNHAGKEAVVRRIVALLKKIGKHFAEALDLAETAKEGAASTFEALLKNIDENKTRVQKLQQRLSNERKSLENRQAALNDSWKRAVEITELSHRALGERKDQCRAGLARKTKLQVSMQKSRNIVAQVEEILNERFGQLKSYFIERKMKLN